MAGFNSAPIEWILLATSVCATGFTAYGLRQAMLDHGFLIATGMNGVRKAVAEMNQRGEGFRLMKCVVVLMASLAALCFAPPPPPYRELPQSLFLVIALIVVSLIMTFHSFLDRQTRLKMAKMTATSHPTDPVTGRKVAHKATGDAATFEPLPDGDRRRE
jgi:hypothetical protein